MSQKACIHIITWIVLKNLIRQLFTDTDSLKYEIENKDVYQDFWNDKDKFNNSDYPENSPCYDKTNKKVIGKFKDEASSIPIVEFVGLKSKTYSTSRMMKKVERLLILEWQGSGCCVFRGVQTGMMLTHVIVRLKPSETLRRCRTYLPCPNLFPIVG